MSTPRSGSMDEIAVSATTTPESCTDFFGATGANVTPPANGGGEELAPPPRAARRLAAAREAVTDRQPVLHAGIGRDRREKHEDREDLCTSHLSASFLEVEVLERIGCSPIEVGGALALPCPSADI